MADSVDQPRDHGRAKNLFLGVASFLLALTYIWISTYVVVVLGLIIGAFNFEWTDIGTEQIRPAWLIMSALISLTALQIARHRTSVPATRGWRFASILSLLFIGYAVWWVVFVNSNP